jgi:murein L,D-transpeptidase YafK
MKKINLKKISSLASALLIMSSSVSFAQQQLDNQEYPGKEYENKLLDIVSAVNVGELDSALTLSDELIETYPDSRIGHLMKGDVLSAMAGDLTRFGQGVQRDKKLYSGFNHELKNRSERQEKHEQINQRIPASILEMGSDKYVFVGEASTGRFFIFGNKNGQPYLVKDYYMSIGKAGSGKQIEGDNKTPVGLYSVTHEIEGKKLPDLYGSGAFPVDYPNKVDSWRKRTGYGIWLHGTPSDTYSRAPWSSEGCFVLSNSDYEDVAPYMREVERPRVLLLDKITWLTQEEHQKRRQNYLSVLQQWVAGWESLDVDKYLSFYDKDQFNFGKGNFSSWAERKRNVTKNKKYIQLSLGLQSMYLYPGEKDMFTVDFKQNYLSNNYKGSSEKTLYWKKAADGKWKIIYENAKAS